MAENENAPRPTMREVLRGLVGDLVEVGIKSSLAGVFANTQETQDIRDVVGLMAGTADVAILRPARWTPRSGLRLVFPFGGIRRGEEKNALSRVKFEIFKSFMVGVNTAVLPVILRLPEEVRNPALVGLVAINAAVIGGARYLGGRMDRVENSGESRPARYIEQIVVRKQ